MVGRGRGQGPGCRVLARLSRGTGSDGGDAGLIVIRVAQGGTDVRRLEDQPPYPP